MQPLLYVLGISGYSGSGKTTLIEQLLPHLIAAGLRVSVIKHTHHDFDPDQPGKDSWRHRQAGAAEVLLAGGQRWALLHELRHAPEPALPALLARLAPCDLVLVEGFKQEPFAKLEVYRSALGKPPLYPEQEDVIAIASDGPLPFVVPDVRAARLCQLNLNAPDGIAGFILRQRTRFLYPPDPQHYQP